MYLFLCFNLQAKPDWFTNSNLTVLLALGELFYNKS